MKPRRVMVMIECDMAAPLSALRRAKEIAFFAEEFDEEGATAVLRAVQIQAKVVRSTARAVRPQSKRRRA